MGPTVAAVYGGGCLFGIAYNLGVAEALVDAGIDLGSASALGTSAGSWAAAHLALGMRFEDSFESFHDRVPRHPDPRPGRLVEITRAVFGDRTRCPTVRCSVVALPTLQRRVLSGADHPIADLVAASSAIPGLLAPHRIAGVRYVDGGVRSMASADLGEGAAQLLVVLPMSGPMFGRVGRLIERRTVREIVAWEHRHPEAAVTLVRPTEAIAGLIHRPDQLLDTARAAECYRLAYEQGRQLAGGIAARIPIAA
jgi:NTE family protein